MIPGPSTALRGVTPARAVAALAASAVVALGAAASVLSPRGAVAIIIAVVGVLVVSVVGLSRRDATALLTLLLGLLLLVPEQFVLVGPLRSVGYPPLLLGMGALVVWAAGRLLGLVHPRAGHPARWALFAFALTSATALAAAFMRPLSELELSGADRSLFPVAAALGIGLLACDAITERERLDDLLQRLVLIGAIAAGIGIVEFAVKTFDYRVFAQLPGLTSNVDLTNATRSGFTRVHAAAAHPIEYAVAISVLVPLALHYALHATDRSVRRRSAVATVVLLAVVPMTVSRSGILAIVVGVGFYVLSLGGRQRFNAAVLAVIGLGVFRALVPGLLGTLRSLVFIGSQDPSILHRQDDYAKIPALIEGHLLIGRGLGTFQPLQYFFLDNQYLGSLIEGGLLGLGSLIALFVVGMGLARGARKRATDPATRSLGQALAASIAALAVSAGTFDQMSFRQTGFLVFLLLGCAGSLWSMEKSRERGADGGLVGVPSQPREVRT